MPAPNGLEQTYCHKQDGEEAWVTEKDRLLPYGPCGPGYRFNTTGDSQDSGGRPCTYFVSIRFSKRGCGHLLGPPVSAWEVVPPGFPWIQQGGG